jgi:hypothetical protein
MNDKASVYEMILCRPLAEIRAPCALYAYTALKWPRFALVHTASNISLLLDWLHEWLRPEIADEMMCDEDFWRGADTDLLGIEDIGLRAFAQYTINKPISRVYAYEQCLYLDGLLEGLADHRFIIGWEARAPRQDIAYGVVEYVG